MTTIRDIASEAGVSVSTVSRVLAGHPDVSPATAATVHSVIERHQFVVNRNARNLKRGATSAVLVMVKGRHNMLFASMLEHVQAAVTAAGRTVVPAYLDEDGNEVAEAERLVAEVKPQGVIFLGGDAGHVASHARRIGPDCPAVVLTNSVTEAGRPAVSSVTTDDRASSRAAVAYLLARGHRRLGIIGGNPEQSVMSRHRQEGVVAALAEAGLSLEPSHYVATRFSLASGYDAAVHLLATAPEVTAVYAMSDIMALGALRALHERGRHVPDDISLIGHDGIDMAAYAVPRLTTVCQPQEAMAARGVDILMRHLGGDPTPVDEFVPTVIIDGESVRPLA